MLSSWDKYILFLHSEQTSALMHLPEIRQLKICAAKSSACEKVFWCSQDSATGITLGTNTPTLLSRKNQLIQKRRHGSTLLIDQRWPKEKLRTVPALLGHRFCSSHHHKPRCSCDWATSRRLGWQSNAGFQGCFQGGNTAQLVYTSPSAGPGSHTSHLFQSEHVWQVGGQGLQVPAAAR